MAENKSVGTRLSEDVVEEIDDFADERGLSRSEALRRAAEAYFIDGGRAEDDSTDDETIREQLRITFFERLLPIVVAAFVATTVALLAVGAVEGEVGAYLGASVVGLAAIAVGADKRLDDTLTTARAAVRELESASLRGAARWVWASLKGGHDAPLKPSGVLERAAYWDLYGTLLLWAALVFILPFAVALEIVGGEAFVQTVGVAATFTPWIIFLFATLLACVLMFVGIVAKFALAFPTTEEADVVDDTVA